MTVTGTLVAEEGAPAAGLDLNLRPYPSRYERLVNELGDPGALPAAVDSTRSGPGGTFTLTAPAVGPYRLEVSAPAEGAASGARHVTPAPLFHALAPLAAPLVLPPIEVAGWRVMTIVATDLEGEPVEGALVVADPGGWRSEPVDTGHGLDLWQRRDQERIVPRFGRAATRTDAAGLARFSLPTVEAGVALSAPGFRLRVGRVGAGGGSFELAPAAGMTVRILDPQGRPVPGAAVTVGERLDVPLGMTNDRGEATVVPVESRSLAYRALAEDHSIGWTAPPGSEAAGAGADRTLAHVVSAGQVEAGDAGTDRTVEIGLEPPAEIAGRITDAATGRPVAGAAIWRRPGEQARAGPTGAFVLRTWLHQGRAQVGVAADGYQATSAMVTAERLGSGDAVDILLAPSAPLKGQVVDASGRPLAGVRLWVEPFGGTPGIGPGGREATSAFDGSFFIAGAAAEHTHRLHVELSGYPARTLEIPAAPAQAAREDVRVVLRRGRSVLGIITDSRGVPIPNTEVALVPVAWSRDGSYSWNSFLRRTSGTDAHGRFEFSGTPAGRFELTANNPDHGSLPAVVFEAPSGEGSKNLGTLTLDAGTPVEGVVRDFNGDPVAGARVRAHQPGALHPQFFFDPNARPAVTDAGGTFRIGGLRTEPADLVVEAEGYARFDMIAVRPQAGKLVEIRLREGARLAGRVVSADGQGAADASVVLNLDHSPTTRPSVWRPLRSGHHARTDANGRFHLSSLGPGPWSVQVLDEDLAEEAGAIRLRPGEEREIELHLRVRSRLVGTVIDPSGAPVTGAEVIVQSLDPAGDPESTDSSPVTDAGGGYEASRVAPGPARIVARHPAWRDGVREVVIGPGTNEVNLEVFPGWEISGAVTTAGGTGVALARVEAEPLDEQADAWRRFLPRSLQAVTAENGTYRIGGVDDGRYELQVQAEGYARAAPGRSPVRVEGGSVTGVDFVLHPGITLRGVVTGRPPEAFAGILVEARQGVLIGGATSPDPEGRFQLADLGPGAWTVRAKERDRRAVERSVTLETGPGEAFVELGFEPGFTLTGEIRSVGQPLAGCAVTILASGQGYDQVRTVQIDRQNRFRVDGLAAGTFTVVIADPSGVTRFRQIELQGHQDILVDLTLPAAGRASRS